ncbi:MAG: hypothetical protein ACLGHA_04015, partial [Gammaproteobacteria bacterium]
ELAVKRVRDGQAVGAVAKELGLIEQAQPTRCSGVDADKWLGEMRGWMFLGLFTASLVFTASLGSI